MRYPEPEFIELHEAMRQLAEMTQDDAQKYAIECACQLITDFYPKAWDSYSTEHKIDWLYKYTPAPTQLRGVRK